MSNEVMPTSLEVKKPVTPVPDYAGLRFSHAECAALTNSNHIQAHGALSAPYATVIAIPAKRGIALKLRLPRPLALLRYC